MSEPPDRRSLLQRLGRDRLLVGVVPVLLIAVALTQITAAHTIDLTPWKGGGFGMFTAIDAPRDRSIYVRAFTADGETITLTDKSVAPEISRVLQDRSDRVRSLPDTRALERLGTVILTSDIHRRVDDNGQRTYTLNPADGVKVNLVGVHIQVRGLDFDPDDQSVSLRLIRDFHLGDTNTTTGGPDDDR